MVTSKKRKPSGGFPQKQDLGQYSKSLGMEPLCKPGTEPLHAKLYK